MHITANSLHSQPPIPTDFSELPQALRDRLAGEGIFDFDSWRALGRRRRQIFGVTAAMCRELDRLARGAA